jgi:hypothetical protein
MLLEDPGILFVCMHEGGQMYQVKVLFYQEIITDITRI